MAAVDIYIYTYIYIYTRISWVEKCVPAMSPSISLFIPSSIYIPLSIFIPDVDACLSVRVFLCLSGFVFFAFVFACCMWFLMCFVLCVSVWSNSCHGLFFPPHCLPYPGSNSHGFAGAPIFSVKFAWLSANILASGSGSQFPSIKCCKCGKN